MLDDRERRSARKWIEWQLRGGTTVAALHELIDTAAHHVLYDALARERKERSRADRAEIRCHELTTELDGVRDAVKAIPKAV